MKHSVMDMDQGNQSQLLAEYMAGRLTVEERVVWFQAFQASVTKKATILIDEKILAGLKNGGYALCVARKVGDTFNVVWRATKEYLYSTTLTWTPQYEVFGTNTFQEGATVTVSARPKAIGIGESIDFDKSGIFGTPYTTDPKDSQLTIKNQYGSIHFGLNQVLEVNGQYIGSLPIYVSKETDLKGTTKLLPKQELMVWFERKYETSTIIGETVTKCAVLDLTHQDAATCEYNASEEWVIPH